MRIRRIAIIVSLSVIVQMAGCTSGEGDDNAAAPDNAAHESSQSTAGANVASNSDVAIATDVAAAFEPVELATIARAHRFGDIYLTSQPSQDDFFAVRDAGIRTVINQRHDRENTDFSEQQVVTDLGMEYHSLAFGAPDELTDEVLDQTRAQFRDAPKPMLIHCASANRTGATWLAYCVLDRGLTMEEALEEARMVGLRSEGLVDVVRDYIERHQDQE